MPPPGAGEVLLRTLWLSLDPYMRGRMSDAPSYAAPVEIGGVMEGGTVSEVVASQQRRLRGRRHRARPHRLADPCGLERQGPAQARSGARAGLDRARRARHAGHDRLYGLARHRQAASRARRVVVAAASGAVGSVVGQIAQDQGRARGRHRRRRRASAATSRTNSASTPASITARRISPSGSRRPARTASTSISRMSAARCSRRCFRCSTPFARMPVCGLISQYNATVAAGGPNWRAAVHARDADQAAHHPRLHRQRFRRAPRGLPARHGGWLKRGPRQVSRGRRRWARATRRRPSSGCCAARISASG